MIVEQTKNEFMEKVTEVVNDAINILVRDAEVDERNLDAYDIWCMKKYFEILEITKCFEEGKKICCE